MTLPFVKYQGAGNDFIMIDNRTLFFKNDTKFIARLCHRKFGIGADGLILLENSKEPNEDFKMVYFNADGKESSMCGNGGRCVVDFAKRLNIIDEKAVFSAIDGSHEAMIENGTVRLQMRDVAKIEKRDSFYLLDTGSPHCVVFVPKSNKIDVKSEGAKIRHQEMYGKNGVNVNFVEVDFAEVEGFQVEKKEKESADKSTKNAALFVRTYERGVEDETLSCGTGVVAAALAADFSGELAQTTIFVQTLGGRLSVSFAKNGNAYRDIWLSGPTELVFEGEINY